MAADRVSYLTVEPEQAGQRLDNFLLRLAKGVPKSHVYRIVRSGEVRVNKGRVDADYRLASGDVLRVPPLRVAAAAKPVVLVRPVMPPILYEDEHLIAVDKPAGLAAHGGSGVSHGLIEQIRAARPHQPFLELVHRLDRETSGILLLAKSRRALLGLHQQMRDGLVEKRYLVLVAGQWHNDRQHVRAALTKFVDRKGERRVTVDAEGMPSHTIFNLRARYRVGARHFGLLEAELRTGRTHQIRVHLAHLGYPIVGDDKYGDFALNKEFARGAVAPLRTRFDRMFLHAFATRFDHPVSGAVIALEAPLPVDCQTLLKDLEHAGAL
jgi:23S rRNA pseudouridine955/2504/2580 synthase